MLRRAALLTLALSALAAESWSDALSKRLSPALKHVSKLRKKLARGRRKSATSAPPTSAPLASTVIDVPEYARRDTWPSVSGLASFAGREPLPAHCLRQPLNPADDPGERSVWNSNGAKSGRCYQLGKRAPNETQPVRARNENSDPAHQNEWRIRERDLIPLIRTNGPYVSHLTLGGLHRCCPPSSYQASPSQRPRGKFVITAIWSHRRDAV